MELSDEGDISQIEQYLLDELPSANKEPGSRDGETSSFYTESPKEIISFKFGKAAGTKLGKYPVHV